MTPPPLPESWLSVFSEGVGDDTRTFLAVAGGSVGVFVSSGENGSGTVTLELAELLTSLSTLLIMRSSQDALKGDWSRTEPCWDADSHGGEPCRDCDCSTFASLPRSCVTLTG